MIQNHALQLLTMMAMEPPSRNRRRRDPRREAEGAALAQALQRRERRPRRRARPVPRRHDRRQAGARLPRGRQGARRQPHRDLRRPAHRGAELALGRRAVLPAHRQAPGRARRADRRQLPADAAHHLPGRAAGRTSWSSSCSRKTASSCTCSPPRAPASPRRWRRCRSTSTSTRRSPRTASAPTSGCCSTSSPAGSTCSCAATSRRKPGAGSSRSCAPGRRDDAGPRPVCRRHLGPAGGERAGGARRLHLGGRGVAALRGRRLRAARPATRAAPECGSRAGRASTSGRSRDARPASTCQATSALAPQIRPPPGTALRGRVGGAAMQHQGAGPGAAVDVDADRGQAGVAPGRMAERIAELGVAVGVDVMAIGRAELRRAVGVPGRGVRVLDEEAQRSHRRSAGRDRRRR